MEGEFTKISWLMAFISGESDATISSFPLILVNMAGSLSISESNVDIFATMREQQTND